MKTATIGTKVSKSAIEAVVTSEKPKKRKVPEYVGKMIGRRTRFVGALGEALVVKHLVQKGFQHVESNFLKRAGELDVIMERGSMLHFFEVKTVSRENFSDVIRETDEFRPEENVSVQKLRKIGRMIKIYLVERKREHCEWQFHVAAVFLDQKNHKALIRFTKNIPVEG